MLAQEGDKGMAEREPCLSVMLSHAAVLQAQ